jgi:Protein of unknwon function (DUF3310)
MWRVSSFSSSSPYSKIPMSLSSSASDGPKLRPIFEVPSSAGSSGSDLLCPDDPLEPTAWDDFYALSNCAVLSGTRHTPSSSSHGPKHYKRGKIEVWDFIRDQSLNYHLGNAVKYICRAGYKESKVDDLKKAIHYLQNELEHST